MNHEISDFLEKAVQQGLNILISGSTQAGKTTLLGALISAISVTQRVITVEEVFELRPNVPDHVSLQTRPANLQGEGEIPLRRLIKEALRMRPSRIIVGEIREAESLDLLIALNSGIPGMATIHANSAKDSIRKIQTLPLLAGENITYQFISPLVASAIDLAVHVDIDVAGKRTISEILYVTGRMEGEHIETEPVFTRTTGGYETGLISRDQILQKNYRPSGKARTNEESDYFRDEGDWL
jgi:pilus assembly protein CpaF